MAGSPRRGELAAADDADRPWVEGFREPGCAWRHDHVIAPMTTRPPPQTAEQDGLPLPIRTWAAVTTALEGSRAIFRRALEHRMNLIDTCDYYSNGGSEEIV